MAHVQVDLLESLNDGDPLDVEKLTDVEFLRHQLTVSEEAFAGRYRGLSTGLCDVVDNYGLLNFTPLAVEDDESLRAVMDVIDAANGFKFSGLQGRNPYAAPG